LWSERGREAGFVIFTFSAEHLTLPPSRIFEVRDLTEPIDILTDLRTSLQRHKGWIEAVREGYEQKAELALKRLELFLLKTIFENETQKTGNPLSQSAKHYAVAVKFLEENLHRNLSVQEIAAACQIGEVNLKKIFSRYAGVGVIAYFNYLKMRAAAELLAHGSTVREASEAMGFLNQNYFCTVFKRVMGKTPKSFKG
jgi:AraC-like DNA-binding protein